VASGRLFGRAQVWPGPGVWLGPYEGGRLLGRAGAIAGSQGGYARFLRGNGERKAALALNNRALALSEAALALNKLALALHKPALALKNRELALSNTALALKNRSLALHISALARRNTPLAGLKAALAGHSSPRPETNPAPTTRHNAGGNPRNPRSTDQQTRAHSTKA
jgi:hypothetical protein